MKRLTRRIALALVSLACALAPLPSTYRARAPEASPLYAAVQGHLKTFLGILGGD